MLDCPCGYGKNLKSDLMRCPVCGMDLTPLHRLKGLSSSYYKIGLKHAEKGNWDDAVRNLFASITLDDKFTESYIALGNLHLKAGLFEEALKQFARALEMEPENADALAGRKQAQEYINTRKHADQKRDKKIHHFKIWLAAGIILSFTAGMAVVFSFQQFSKAEKVNELKASNEIYKHLSGYSALIGSSINILEYDDEIVISGEVLSESQKALVTEIAAIEADGKWIDAEKLSIKSTPIPLTDIAERLRSAFINNPNLSGIDIKVVEENSVILLSGNLPGEIYRSLVIEMSRNICALEYLDLQDLKVIPPEVEPILLPYLEYTVKQGDSLSKIAYNIYGSYDLWTRIYDENRDVLPDYNSLKAGQKLNIPILPR